MTVTQREEAWREGACHCGTIRFRARLSGSLAAARRCDCSFCRMRGAVALTALVGDLKMVDGADKLTRYTFNTGVAKHYFCSLCGIYTHHQRRSDPNQYGINAACLGISPFSFEAVPVNDGVNHPLDAGGDGDGIIGTLHFVKAR